MGLFWTGPKWPEQEGPSSGTGDLAELEPYRLPDPMFYRVVGRAGVSRVKPRGQRPTVAGVLGIVYLTVVAGLLAGGVIFWLRLLQNWLGTR